MLPKSLFMLTTSLVTSCVGLAASVAAERSNALALTLNDGFWSGDFQVGEGEMKLTVDSGSYALLINQGEYRPSKHSTPTGKGSYLQFSGGNQNGTENIDVGVSYVSDTVSTLNYNLSDFWVGNITAQSALLPSNGVLGLAQEQSYSIPSDPSYSNGESFVHALCDKNLINHCGFGILLGTNGKGLLVFGEMEGDKYKGEVVSVQTTKSDFWQVDPSSPANPRVVVNSESISPINVSFDSGSPNVFAPYEQGLKVLRAANLNITTSNTTDGTGIAYGTYPCEQKPPRIGFNFNNQSLQDSLYIDREANILEKSMVNGKEICRVNILATEAMDQDLGWLVGQTWFQGRYVQHDIKRHELMFADLKVK